MLRLALALALLAAPEPADEEAARLAQGEILVTVLPAEGRNVPPARARAVIDTPPARLFAVITDCANYQKNMENIRESKEVSATRAPDGSLVRVCRVTFHLPFPLPDLTSVSRAVETAEPGGRLRRAWKLVEGDYERNEGYWLVEPYGEGGQRSLVTYVLDVQPKLSLPGSFVSRAQQKQLKGVLEHLREVTKQP